MPHNVRIARSGVYYYHKSELPTLGISSVPREWANLNTFGVYRPSHVVADSAPLFKGKPVIMGHTGTVYSPLDSRIIGESTNKVAVSMVNGEAVITSELVMDSAHDDIAGCVLSPGYYGNYRWRAGVAPSGEQFQITLDSIDKVNHIAIVPVARGGNDMAVLDGIKKKIHSGLVRFAKRRTVMTTDGSDCPFSQAIDELGKTIAQMPAIEVEAKVNSMLNMCTDLPDSIEKQKLQRYLADVPLLKDEPQEVVDNALLVILQLYRSLDADAISDVLEDQTMATPTTPAETQAVANTAEQTPATQPAAPETAGTTQTENQSANEPSAQTQDGLPVPTPAAAPALGGLEQVMQVLQQISAKLDALCPKPEAPAAPAPAAPEKPAEKPAEPEKPAPQTTDSACEGKVPTTDGIPMYTQTLATMQTGESLDDVFAKMKGRK